MLWHSYLLWLRTDCIDLSAAFAYHTLQSFFPALLIGLSLASRWLGRDRDLLEQLLHLIGQIIPISFQPVVEENAYPLPPAGSRRWSARLSAVGLQC